MRSQPMLSFTIAAVLAAMPVASAAGAAGETFSVPGRAAIRQVVWPVSGASELNLRWDTASWPATAGGGPGQERFVPPLAFPSAPPDLPPGLALGADPQPMHIGVEVLPTDGPKTGAFTLYDWVRSFGVTLVKLRNSEYDAAGLSNDQDQASGAIAAGLKLVTRPGPLSGANCGEGLPLWDDEAGVMSPCAEEPIHRWFGVIRGAVGAGNEPRWWYAHVLANEPMVWYDDNGGAAKFQEHLGKAANRILASGWNWIPIVTPPPRQYVGEDDHFNAVFNVLADPAMRQAFTFIGAHNYWNNDAERDARIAYLNNLAARAARFGKVLLVDEFSANSPQRAGGAPYDCSYTQDSPGETARSKRAGSMRHFIYVTRGQWDRVMFLLTGDPGWKDMDMLPRSTYDTERCGPNPWLTDTGGQHSDNVPDANQYAWIAAANDPAKVP